MLNNYTIVLHSPDRGLVRTFPKCNRRPGLQPADFVGAYNQDNEFRIIDENGDEVVLTSEVGGIEHAELSWQGVSSVECGISGVGNFLVDSTGKSGISFAGVLSANLTDDMDTGAAVTSSWLAVIVEWERKTPTAPNLTFTSTVSSPTLTGSNDAFRRVGWCRTKAGVVELIRFRQRWAGKTRRFIWDDEESDLQLVSTSGVPSLFTDLDISSRVPPTSTLAIIGLGTGINVGVDRIHFRPNGSSTAVPVQFLVGAGGLAEIATDGSQVIEWMTTSGGSLSADINAISYDDDLEFNDSIPSYE